MKFVLRNADSMHSIANAQKLIDEFGFEFKHHPNWPWTDRTEELLSKIIDVEINTLDELMTFCEKWGGSEGIIVNVSDELSQNKPVITMQFDGFLDD